jgi:hypothetical protein
MTKLTHRRGLPSALEAEAEKSLQAAMKQCDDLFQLGFTQNEFGEFRATGCTVLFYPVGGEVEIDIHAPERQRGGVRCPSARHQGREAQRGGLRWVQM